MAKASDLYLTFCDQNEHVNDLVAWYQFENLFLQTALHGDISMAIAHLQLVDMLK